MVAKMILEPYFGSSWTMLMENNLLPCEQGWMAWKDQLEELSVIWRVIIASVNPCKQSYVILFLQMKSDTDPRRRRGIEPCFLCSLPLFPAASGKGSSTVFLRLTVHFFPKWTLMKAWVPGSRKSTYNFQLQPHLYVAVWSVPLWAPVYPCRKKRGLY